MIDSLHPGVKGSPNAVKQLVKLARGVFVGPAFRIVPVARQLDELSGCDLDGFEP